jgi:hypothetical protein
MRPSRRTWRAAASPVVVLAVLGLVGAASPATAHTGHTIVVTTTIQAAVDAAQPGDTILVPPGTYRESVQVTKSHLRIVGSRAAVIDAAGFRTGIRVGTGTISRGGPVPACPPLAVEGFTLKGLTIKHAGFSGVFLIGVDGYRLTGTRYVDNPVYGPFPVCSRNGLIDLNQVVGGGSTVGPSLDTGIYVGDDDQVTVRNNSVTNYVIGVVVENTVNATVQDNLLKGNTAGIYVAVFPDHPRPFTDHVVIERNQVLHNNLPNPVPAGSGDEIGLVPTRGGDRQSGRRPHCHRPQPGAGQRLPRGRDRAEPAGARGSSNRTQSRLQPGAQECDPPQRPGPRSGPCHHPGRRHRL